MRSDTPLSCATARSGRRVTGLSGAGTGSPASQTTSNSYVLSVSSVSATRFVESKTSFRTCTPGVGIMLALKFVQSIREARPSLANEMPVQRFITTSSKYRSTKYLSSSGVSPAFLMPQCPHPPSASWSIPSAGHRPPPLSRSTRQERTARGSPHDLLVEWLVVSGPV